jgi:hypothetical protein
MEKSQRAKMTALVGFAAMFLLGGMGGAQSSKSPQTWQGFVTDTHCGTNCQVTKDMKPDKQCVVRCVRKGSKYGLWVEHHVYELEPQSKAVQYAAKDVSVSGWLDGEVIHINSIKAKDPATTKKSDSN